MSKPSERVRALINDKRVELNLKRELRLVARVIDKFNLQPDELVTSSPRAFAQMLAACSVKDPGCRAARLPKLINALAEIFPEEGLPVTPMVSSNKIFLPALDDEPRQLQIDIAQARAHQVERARVMGVLAPIATGSHEVHIRSTRELLGALRRRTMPISAQTGVRTLINPVCFAAGLTQLAEEGNATSTIYKIGLGVIAIGKDIFDEDDPGLPPLRAEMNGRAPGHQVSVDHCIRLVDCLLEDGIQTILAAPAAIAERATEKHLMRMARRSRSANALALDLKLYHTGLPPREVPLIHLDQSFEEIDGQWHFRYRPYRSSDEIALEAMQESSVELMHRFEGKFGDESRLLFPNRKNNTRHFNPVMMELYRDFELVSGFRLTFMFLKDVSNTASLLGEGEECFLQTSQSSRYKHSSSCAARLITVLDYLKARREKGLDRKAA